MEKDLRFAQKSSRCKEAALEDSAQGGVGEVVGGGRLELITTAEVGSCPSNPQQRGNLCVPFVWRVLH